MSGGPIHIPATVVGEDIFVETERSLFEIVPSVLIVDDSSPVRRVVSRLLHEAGISDVREAEDASTAMRLLHERRFAAVIADVEMVPFSGIQLLRAIRNQPATADMTVLLMTARSDRAQIAEAKASGVDAYMLKPFTAATLAETLREAARAHPTRNRFAG
jgi:two-component system chemotaxis response regulator CheY